LSAVPALPLPLRVIFALIAEGFASHRRFTAGQAFFYLVAVLRRIKRYAVDSKSSNGSFFSSLCTRRIKNHARHDIKRRQRLASG